MNRHETGARAQVSRRTLLTGAGKGAGALGAGLLLAQSGLLRSEAAGAAHALTTCIKLILPRMAQGGVDRC